MTQSFKPFGTNIFHDFPTNHVTFSTNMPTFSNQVSREDHCYSVDIEAREEGGTPAIVGSIRAGLAFQLKQVSL